MEYETLNINDNGTIKVRMTIGDKVLEQDFEADNLDDNVKKGMAIFKAELDRNVPVVVDEALVGKVVIVKSLPEIPAKDFEVEPAPEEEK